MTSAPLPNLSAAFEAGHRASHYETAGWCNLDTCEYDRIHIAIRAAAPLIRDAVLADEFAEIDTTEEQLDEMIKNGEPVELIRTAPVPEDDTHPALGPVAQALLAALVAQRPGTVITATEIDTAEHLARLAVTTYEHTRSTARRQDTTNDRARLDQVVRNAIDHALRTRGAEGEGRAIAAAAPVLVEYGQEQERWRIADQIAAELICCDVFTRTVGTEARQRAAQGPHAICFWGEAARHIALNPTEPGE